MDKVILLPGGAYNFGSETTQSIYEVTNKFVDMLGKRLIVKDAPARHNLWMDCSKARKYGVEFNSVIDGLERSHFMFFIKIQFLLNILQLHPAMSEVE